MSVITQATITAVCEVYRATGSLAATAAILQRAFRALTEAQPRNTAARIVSIAPGRRVIPPQSSHPGDVKGGPSRF